ncbi:MAG: PilZ domain-containing protein [Oligoflexia bacterium]|nr:PilZ domain-containing protein [Oligoflexia bacterium]
MDFLTTFVAHRFTIGIRGKIESDFKFPDTVWKSLEENPAISEVVLVLRKIEGYDQGGIDAWQDQVNLISEKGFDLTFIECPKNLLEPLMKNRKQIFSRNIRSFIVPYYCSTCNEEFPQLINTSSISLSFATYSKPNCPTCEKQLTLDITEDEIQRIASLLPVESDSYEDKRRYPRFDVSTQNIRAVLSRGNFVYDFKVINFSEAGICIYGSFSMEISGDLEVEITYNNRKISSTGTVAWFSKETETDYFIGISLENNDIYRLLIKS